ncbi:MAG: sulfatase-like hydrolase/transferase [Candidatus Melainabacteria bacterium]|nr:sulfatase-like hydrolase/transferase [Candidatus Melainabacteria bacterium]
MIIWRTNVRSKLPLGGASHVITLLSLILALFSNCFLPAIAQQPVLPPPPKVFTGVSNQTLEGSKPDWPKTDHAPAGAPNIIVVLVDDAGFGNPSTFGGPMQTPALDQLASGGLRYNRFHVTALCSPSRAALLSGRNQHSVGFGSISELAGGWPGYNARWPKSAASIARILQGNGYSTAAFGKWHLTPSDEWGPSGPFERWPTGLGFGYFWGFLGGDTDQYSPLMFENTKIIGTPKEKDFFPNHCHG